MKKIIIKKMKNDSWSFNIIFENNPLDNDELKTLFKVIRTQTLNNVKNSIVPEFSSPWMDVYHGEEDDNYYIAFYDPIFDSEVIERSKKIYNEDGRVFDDETPMLRLSKENFEHLLEVWQHIKKYEPTYIILTQTNNNWIDMWPKNELTSEEITLVEKY